MPQSYAPEFKKKIVRLHAEEGRTCKSITAEYGVSKASISKWCSEFSRECQTKALENPDTPNERWLSLYFKGAGRVVYKCGHDTQVIFLADRNGLAGGQGDLIAGYFYDVCHIDQITFMGPDECGTREILFNLFQRSGKGVIFAGS